MGAQRGRSLPVPPVSLAIGITQRAAVNDSRSSVPEERPDPGSLLCVWAPFLVEKLLEKHFMSDNIKSHGEVKDEVHKFLFGQSLGFNLFQPSWTCYTVHKSGQVFLCCTFNINHVASSIHPTAVLYTHMQMLIAHVQALIAHTQILIATALRSSDGFLAPLLQQHGGGARAEDAAAPAAPA